MAISEEKTRVAITLGNTLLARIDDYCERTSQTRSGYIASVVGRDLESQRAVLDGVMDAFTELLAGVISEQEEKPKTLEEASQEDLLKALWGEDYGKRPDGL